MAALGWLMNLGFAASEAVAVVPDTPGMTATLPTNRFEATLRAARFDAILPTNRFEATLPDEELRR